MALLRCDEGTLFTGLAIICIVLAIITIARAVVYVVSACLEYLTHISLHPVLERLACATALLVSLALFADGTALLPALAVLATLTSGVFCWSLLSFRWLCVSAFALYCTLLLYVLAPAVGQVLDGSKGEWMSLMRHQHLLFSPSFFARASPSPAPLTTFTEERTTTQRVYSYFDGVKLEAGAGTISGAAATAEDPARALRDLTPMWLQGLLPQPRGSVQAKKNRKKSSSTPADERKGVSTYVLLATGEDTWVTNYREAATATSVDALQLLGPRSRLHNSHVFCLVSPPPPSKDSTDVLVPTPAISTPCMRLHQSSTLRNVTVHWAQLPPAAAEAVVVDLAALTWHTFQAGSQSSQTCAQVQEQLLSLNGRLDASNTFGEKELHGAAPSPIHLLDCVSEMDVEYLQTPFITEAPFFVRFKWSFPTYLRRAQTVLLFFLNRVLLPVSALLGEAVKSAGRAALVVLVQSRILGLHALPHLKRVSEHTLVYFRGVLCGSAAMGNATVITSTSTSTNTTVGTEVMGVQPTPTDTLFGGLSFSCASYARVHAEDGAFIAGARTRATLHTLLATCADAVDLVPGVWGLFKWAWDAEVSTTAAILRAVYRVTRVVFLDLPQPVLRQLSRFLSSVASVLSLLAPPLRQSWALLPRISVSPYISRLGSWLWAWELQWWGQEWVLLGRLIDVVTAGLGVLLLRALDYMALATNWIAVLHAEYGRSSLSIHLTATVLQTVLLFLALRNEMRDQMVAEARQRQISPGAVYRFAQRLLPIGIASALPFGDLAARASGFMALLRAHHSACVNYLVLHFVALVVLVGLSVIPFTTKLYGLVLHYILPWLSSEAFLLFFTARPRRRVTMLLFGLRLAFATVMQRTVGDFVHRILVDAAIGLGLMAALVLLIWAWPQRTALAKQMATAIVGHLPSTPAPTPRRGGGGGGVAGSSPERHLSGSVARSPAPMEPLRPRSVIAAGGESEEEDAETKLEKELDLSDL